MLLHVVRSIYVFMFLFLMMDFRLTAGRRVRETTANVDPCREHDPQLSSFVAVVDRFEVAAAYDIERHRQFVVDIVEGGRCSKMGCRNDIGLEVRHLVRHGSVRTTPKRGPLPGAPLSTKYGRQST